MPLPMTQDTDCPALSECIARPTDGRITAHSLHPHTMAWRAGRTVFAGMCRRRSTAHRSRGHGGTARSPAPDSTRRGGGRIPLRPRRPARPSRPYWRWRRATCPSSHGQFCVLSHTNSQSYVGHGSHGICGTASTQSSRKMCRSAEPAGWSGQCWRRPEAGRTQEGWPGRSRQPEGTEPGHAGVSDECTICSG